jgi:hypothetical protein
MAEYPIQFSAAEVVAAIDGQKTVGRLVVKPQPVSAHHYIQAMHGTSPDGHKFGDPGLWREVGPDYPDDSSDDRRSPCGQPGDLLWVRERYAFEVFPSPAHPPEERIVFHADRASRHIDLAACQMDQKSAEFFLPSRFEPSRWKAAAKMPRWASRLTLKVTGIRAQRLRDITPLEAISEGAFQIPTESVRPGYAEAAGAATAAGEKPPLGPGPVERFMWLWNQQNAPRGFGWATNPWVWVVEFKKVEVANG